MTTYTKKKDKNISNWLFHPSYFTEETRVLPKCIQRELVVRLSKLKHPILDVKELNPKIESKLLDLTRAYVRKQGKVAENRRILHDLRAEKESESGSETSESESEEESFLEKSLAKSAGRGQDPEEIGVQDKPKPKPKQVNHDEFHNWFSSIKQKK